MSQNVSDVSNGKLGNTSPISRIRSRRWCFTLNNYTNEEYDNIMSQMSHHSYIIGKEVGEQGTPHLQGYLECKNQVDFNVIKKINNRLHIEKAKGDKKQNIAYCSKEKDFKTNFKIPKEIKKAELFLPWQFELKNKLTTQEPDDRTIYWYWSEKGGLGKSTFVKHMVDYEDVAFINKGKYGDMINQIYNYEDVPEIVMIDIPRSMTKISYSALEDIKNGLIANSKYETGFKRFNPPHIIVFCNFAPEYDAFSDDRIVEVFLS